MSNENTISLNEIEVLSFALNPKPDHIVKSFKYIVNIDTKVKGSSEKNLLTTITTVHFLEDETKSELGSLQVGLVFKIENYDQVVVKKSETRIQIEDKKKKRLALISMDTLRGIAFTYLKGTYIQSILIPLIPADQVLTTNLENI